MFCKTPRSGDSTHLASHCVSYHYVFATIAASPSLNSESNTPLPLLRFPLSAPKTSPSFLHSLHPCQHLTKSKSIVQDCRETTFSALLPKHRCAETPRTVHIQFHKPTTTSVMEQTPAPSCTPTISRHKPDRRHTASPSTPSFRA